MPQLNLVPIPPEPGPELRIVRLLANQQMYLTVISYALWGTMTHWWGNRSHPCVRPKTQCAGCKSGWPQRWKGYLHVLDETKRKECFVELTPAAAKSLLAAYPDNQSLRGQRMKLQRGDGDKAWLKVQCNGICGYVDALPTPKDVHNTLMDLWGRNTKQVFGPDSTNLPNIDVG